MFTPPPGLQPRPAAMPASAGDVDIPQPTPDVVPLPPSPHPMPPPLDMPPEMPPEINEPPAPGGNPPVGDPIGPTDTSGQTVGAFVLGPLVAHSPSRLH